MATFYYLTDYSDEVTPCAPTPEAWAKWLSEGDPEWGDGIAPAAPGQTFKASALTIFAHVHTVCGADGVYRLPADTPQADFAAVVSGEGDTNWGSDDILEPNLMEQRLADYHADEVCVALGRLERRVATYHGPDHPMTFAEVTEH